MDPPEQGSVPGFFKPSAPVGRSAGNLPHWRQDGVLYFVTFRLADSVPESRLNQWESERQQWLRQHPPPHTPGQAREFATLFTNKFHLWLDACHGACVLSKPEVADAMKKVLTHFNSERYVLGEHVIMPNHVHAVVAPLAGHELSGIVHSWKSYSANRINVLLGRRGALWQREYFDHIIRNENELERISSYIRGNPKLISK